MKTPKISFSYIQEKDIANINIGLNTIKKGRVPEKELKNIIEKYGPTPSVEELKNYLDKKWSGKEEIIGVVVKQLQEYWDFVEKGYFSHLADRMQLESFFDIEKIDGYFSSRYGCGYNVDGKWFAASLYRGTLDNTTTAMHEIMHIFFHKQWWNFCQNEGVEEKNIWDVKEATTVLLNLWFKNKIIFLDFGYLEHTELRSNILSWFLENRDFKKTLIKSCEYIKNNKEKSPNWITN